jgi:hypothetical protein
MYYPQKVRWRRTGQPFERRLKIVFHGEDFENVWCRIPGEYLKILPPLVP